MYNNNIGEIAITVIKDEPNNGTNGNDNDYIRGEW